jgi:hypothetical protein
MPYCNIVEKEGYTTSPPLAELRRMPEHQLKSVVGFCVSCKGKGSVTW